MMPATFATDIFADMPIVKPYALMDLDDTLFQTLRKIEAWGLADGSDNAPTPSLTVASVNKQGEPLSFFTPKQLQFFHWLSHSTELIPVTARDRQEIQRVRLPFPSWQVLTHGAVIVQADGQVLPEWETRMANQLLDCQSVLAKMIGYLDELNTDNSLASTPHTDRFVNQALTIYVAVKHRDKKHDALQELADKISAEFVNFNRYFYIHVNANNLAILPHCVHKHHAVAFLQQHYLDKNRASFGFGDSLADVPFLQCLDWYGTPRHGQLNEVILRLLEDKDIVNTTKITHKVSQ